MAPQVRVRSLSQGKGLNDLNPNSKRYRKLAEAEELRSALNFVTRSHLMTSKKDLDRKREVEREEEEKRSRESNSRIVNWLETVEAK
jgi:hypothetical protein